MNEELMTDEEFWEDDVPFPEDEIEPTKLNATKIPGGIRFEYMLHDGLPAVRVRDAYNGEVALYTDPVSKPWELKEAVLRFNEVITANERYMQAVAAFTGNGKGM